MPKTFTKPKYLPNQMVSLLVITMAFSLSLLGCTEKKAKVEVKRIKVVEILNDKKAGEKLVEEDLGEEEITDDPDNQQFIEEYVKDPKLALGKVARYKLIKGQQVMKRHLISVPDDAVVLSVEGEEMAKLFKLKEEGKSSLAKVATKFLEEEIEKAEVKETPKEKPDDSKDEKKEPEKKAPEKKKSKK